MAKLICAALALFLLFAFSHARTPSDVPNGLDGVSASTLRLLRLPSERHNPENVAEHKTVDQPEEEKVLEAEFATIMSHEENTADGSMSETIPLTVFSFESHRQFLRRPFRVGGGRHGRRHNCGHHHVQQRVHPENDEMGNENNAQVDTPNGGDNNDQMVSSSSSLADGIMKMDRLRGGGQARWTNFRHVGPRFPYEHNDVIDSELPHRHHHRHRHHPSHRHHDESELQNDAEEHHEEEHEHHEHEQEHEHHEHEHEHEHREHEHEHEHREHEHEHEHREHEHEHKHREHEHEHEHHEHEHEHEHEQEQGHGLFKGIRKFLNGF